MEQFKQIEKIGEGSYGSVYKSRNRETGQVVAIKEVIWDDYVEGIPATAIREISLLKELKHTNIIRLYNVIMEERHAYMVLEFLSMDLRKYIDSLPTGKQMDSKLVKSYLYQISNAILFCHCRRILHRDLKPENLLIDDKGIIKLADFGLARTFAIPVRPYSVEILTLWYKAPEVLLGSILYTCSIDIWSIGCIFAEMLNRKPLFPGDSEIDQLFKIFKILKTPTEDIWPGVTSLPYYEPGFPNWTTNDLINKLPNLNGDGFDLIQKMIIYDPIKRISAKEILEHSFFHGFQLESSLYKC